MNSGPPNKSAQPMPGARLKLRRQVVAGPGWPRRSDRMSQPRTAQKPLKVVPDEIEEQRWFDEQCRFEAREKRSRELVSWLQKGKRGDRELGELTRRQAVRFANRLYSLGAAKVWAAGIERDCDGAEYAKRLIIALPDSSEQRGRIFKLCAGPARPYLTGVAPAARIGWKYMSVHLM